jgi:hypothetical protein
MAAFHKDVHMQFSIYKWNRYRARANGVGVELQKIKEKNGGKLNMKDEETIEHIDAITGILDECSNYMRECGMIMPPTLWQYDPKDETTHISNKDKFAFGHLMHSL